MTTANTQDIINFILEHDIPNCVSYSLKKFVDSNGQKGIKILNRINILKTMSNYAYKTCMFPIYEYLIKVGIDINHEDYHKYTPIGEVINNLINLHNKFAINDDIIGLGAESQKIENYINVIKLLLRSKADTSRLCFIDEERDINVRGRWIAEKRNIDEMLVLTALIYQDHELLNLLISKIKNKRSISKILVSGLVMLFVYLSDYSELHYMNYTCPENYKENYINTEHFIQSILPLFDTIFNNISPDIKFNGKYPLILLSVDHNLFSISELLITRYRVNVNIKSNTNVIGNIYPLERAMFDLNISMVKLLLQNGSRINNVILDNFIKKLRFEGENIPTVNDKIIQIFELILIYNIDGKYKPVFYDNILDKWNLVNNYPQIHKEIADIINKHKRINETLKTLSTTKITQFINNYVKDYIYRPSNLITNNNLITVDPGSGIFQSLVAKYPNMRKRKLSQFGKKRK
jgi:hypothetical protein